MNKSVVTFMSFEVRCFSSFVNYTSNNDPLASHTLKCKPTCWFPAVRTNASEARCQMIAEIRLNCSPVLKTSLCCFVEYTAMNVACTVQRDDFSPLSVLHRLTLNIECGAVFGLTVYWIVGWCGSMIRPFQLIIVATRLVWFRVLITVMVASVIQSSTVSGARDTDLNPIIQLCSSENETVHGELQQSLSIFRSPNTGTPL